MRKVILGLGVSLDGYIARLNGDVDFLFMPRDYSMAEFLAGIDTAIMGRKTFDVARAMGGGSFAGKQMTTYVFSRSKPAGEREDSIFVNQAPEEFIKKLRRRRGKDIWLMGGGELARDFLKAQLIDEIHLGIVPVLLGQGIPAFPGGFAQANFSLLENRTYSRGLIGVKYRRLRRKQT